MLLKTEPLLVLIALGLLGSAGLLYVARYALGRPLSLAELGEIMAYIVGPTGLMAIVARSLVSPTAGADGKGDSSSTPTSPAGKAVKPMAPTSLPRLALALACAALSALPALALVACTPAEQNIAAQVAQDVAAFCPTGLVMLGAPGLDPICAAIPEIEAVIAQWVAEAKTTASTAAPAPRQHTVGDLVAAIQKNRAAAAQGAQK